MALQSSGRINLKQIATEYTDTAPHNMSEFYNGGSAGVSSNLVPSSGAIYLSDFYGATASTTVDSSAETILLVKAAGSGLENDAITYQNSSDVSTGFTETGNPQASTFSPYRSGGYSTYFDGTGDYLSTSDASNAIGSGDFTVEAWVYVTSLSSDIVIASSRVVSSSSNLYYNLGVTTAGKPYFQTRASGGTQYTAETAAGTIETNKWYHIAGVRESNVNKIYVNGTVGSTTSNDGGLNLTEATIGVGFFNYPGYVYYMSGYIRDFRLVKGTAVYTSAFTPPTEALTAVSGTELLACHLPYIADGSTNDHSITVSGNAHTEPFGPYDYSPWTADDVGGSVYFDNTAGDRILTSATSAIGTSDFTIEAWVYPNSFSTQEPIICCSDDTTGDTNNWQMNLDANGDLVFRYNGSTSVTSTAGTVLNTWNHVAVTATGGTIYLWVNGKTDTNVSYSHNYTDTRIKIGVNRSHAQTFDGYIADARVIIGTAQYTSNFTPPTAPLSHTGSQTTLLMNNKSDANIYDAAAGNVLVSVEDPLYNEGVRSNTASRQFTTSSSMYWSGEGNYLQLVDNDNLFTFGTGDFTIEFWMRADATASGPNSPILIDFRNTFTASLAPLLYISVNSTDLKWFVNGSTRITGTSSFTTGTWYHIAVSRSSGSTKMFVDGTQVGSTYSDTNNYIVHTDRPVIGTNGGDVTAGHFQGRMQDIRITKGLGRYTANFTPPTAEFEL